MNAIMMTRRCQVIRLLPSAMASFVDVHPIYFRDRVFTNNWLASIIQSDLIFDGILFDSLNWFWHPSPLDGVPMSYRPKYSPKCMTQLWIKRPLSFALWKHQKGIIFNLLLSKDRINSYDVIQIGIYKFHGTCDPLIVSQDDYVRLGQSGERGHVLSISRTK